MDRRDDDLLKWIELLKSGQGDAEAFAPIYRHYYGPILRYFQKRHFRPDRCHDLTQEVFLRVFKKAADLQDARSFQGWLFTIATHLANNWATRELPKDRHEWIEDHAEELETATAENPEARVTAAEREALLQAAMETLPVRMRVCVVLRARGFSYQQIADAAGVSLQTVRSQLFDGRQRMKTYLESRGIRGKEQR